MKQDIIKKEVMEIFGLTEDLVILNKIQNKFEFTISNKKYIIFNDSYDCLEVVYNHLQEVEFKKNNDSLELTTVLRNKKEFLMKQSFFLMLKVEFIINNKITLKNKNLIIDLYKFLFLSPFSIFVDKHVIAHKLNISLRYANNIINLLLKYNIVELLDNSLVEEHYNEKCFNTIGFIPLNVKEYFGYNPEDLPRLLKRQSKKELETLFSIFK
jgi:hypothetical protein